jgi:alkyl hydroperoxide reductase subunit AhpC
MRSWLRAHGFTSFLAVACLALASQVFLLARQNRALKEARAQDGAAAADPLRFRVGEPFTPFELRTPEGELLRVSFGDGAPRTLLFVLADACPVCPQVVPRWQEIAPHFLDEGARVLGVLLDRAARGGEWIPGVPLAPLADLARVPLAKLKTVPITLLIDAAGAIEWVHYGTLTEGRVIELMAHL